MQNLQALLTQSKEVVATAHATVADTRRATARATQIVAKARELVQRSQDAADARRADRLAFAHAGK